MRSSRCTHTDKEILLRKEEIFKILENQAYRGNLRWFVPAARDVVNVKVTTYYKFEVYEVL